MWGFTNMQAMILAAGFGTRLLPYSKIHPKPLFPILNQPLLVLTIKRMQNSGFDRIVVNCHHLKEQICEALSDIDGVIVQEEKDILGTGGGLGMARRHFKNEPILVSNGDIYHTVDYSELYKSHKQKRALVTLAVHDFPRFNTIEVQEGCVRSFTNQKGKDLLAFTGLHVLEPEVLEDISSEGPVCIIDVYKKMLLENMQINVTRVDNCFWTDMGTLEDYLALHGGLIKGEIPCWEELGQVSQKNFHDDAFVNLGENIQVEEWACMGKVKVGNNVRIKRSILWDNVQVNDDENIVDTLVV